MHIKNWPEGDRPREMLLEKGPEALSDAALLAILTVEDTPHLVFPKLQKNWHKSAIIVTPANLSFQWQRELKDKFRLPAYSE